MLEILLLALGLSMDSFSVALALGALTKKKLSTAFKVAFSFGFFQAVMPLLGWFLGLSLKKFIVGVDHWIAFFILGLIGLKMIKDSSLKKNKNINSASFFNLIFLSLATSIDAMVVGLSFAFIKINIFYQLVTIGLVTFFISFLAIITGHRLGSFFKTKASLIGGGVLIFIGIKILLEHLI